MTISQLIRQSNPINFDLMVELRMKTVFLRYDQSISKEIKQGISEVLDQLSVLCSETAGIPVFIGMDHQHDNTIALYKDDQPLYRFRLTGDGADVQAIGWVIYLLCNDKELPAWNPGDYIASICFSAPQQAAAFRLLQSIKKQSETFAPKDALPKIGSELLKLTATLENRIPLFSERPISEASFEEARRTPLNGTLAEIAPRLFGGESFQAVVEDFIENLKSGQTYKTRVADGCKMLKTCIYDLPLMCVGYFCSEFQQTISKIAANQLDYLPSLLQERVSLQFSDKNINEAFHKVDQAYYYYARALLQQAFLQEVLQKTQDSIAPLMAAARSKIKEYQRALAPFCFVDENCFGIGKPGLELLNWKRLLELPQDVLSVCNAVWDGETINRLQILTRSKYATQIWFCSDRLRNKAIQSCVTDTNGMLAIPIQDERLIWVLIHDPEQGGIRNG